MSERATVIEWDVLDGDILGALIVCLDCPCSPGHGCDGDGVLHRAYELPGSAHIDIYRDPDVYLAVLDRHRRRHPAPPSHSEEEGNGVNEPITSGPAHFDDVEQEAMELAGRLRIPNKDIAALNVIARLCHHAVSDGRGTIALDAGECSMVVEWLSMFAPSPQRKGAGTE